MALSVSSNNHDSRREPSGPGQAQLPCPPPGEAAPPWPVFAPWGSPFAFDLLLIHQRVLSLSERYDVLDPQGAPVFHVRRMLRAGGVALAGVGRLVFIIILFYFAWRFFAAGRLLAALILLWAAGPLGDLVFLFSAPFRHIFIYLAWGAGDPEAAPPVLSVSQDSRSPLWRRFTLFDDLGGPVAQFEKRQWTDLYRRQWRVYSPSGELICRILEDSWPRAIARRLLGNFFGLLKTDFHFYDPQGQRLGSYTRRWTLLDRYVLDLRADPWRRLDRRVALAAGILLDTGERR